MRVYVCMYCMRVCRHAQRNPANSLPNRSLNTIKKITQKRNDNNDDNDNSNSNKRKHNDRVSSSMAKRHSEKQLTKDDPEDMSDQVEMGEFSRANDAELARRTIKAPRSARLSARTLAPAGGAAAGFGAGAFGALPNAAPGGGSGFSFGIGSNAAPAPAIGSGGFGGFGAAAGAAGAAGAPSSSGSFGGFGAAASAPDAAASTSGKFGGFGGFGSGNTSFGSTAFGQPQKENQEVEEEKKKKEAPAFGSGFGGGFGGSSTVATATTATTSLAPTSTSTSFGSFAAAATGAATGASTTSTTSGFGLSASAKPFAPAFGSGAASADINKDTSAPATATTGGLFGSKPAVVTAQPFTNKTDSDSMDTENNATAAKAKAATAAAIPTPAFGSGLFGKPQEKPSAPAIAETTKPTTAATATSSLFGVPKPSEPVSADKPSSFGTSFGVNASAVPQTKPAATLFGSSTATQPVAPAVVAAPAASVSAVSSVSIEEYLKDVRGLNVSFKDAIIAAIEKDSFVNLQPLFAKYEEHRKSVDAKKPSTSASAPSISTSTAPAQAPTSAPAPVPAPTPAASTVPKISFGTTSSSTSVFGSGSKPSESADSAKDASTTSTASTAFGNKSFSTLANSQTTSAFQPKMFSPTKDTATTTAAPVSTSLFGAKPADSSSTLTGSSMFGGSSSTFGSAKPATSGSIFGSTSGSGNGFSSAPAFGGGSSGFGTSSGGLFGMATSSAAPAPAPVSAAQSNEEGGGDGEEPELYPDDEPQIDAESRMQGAGEENDETLFQVRCKLYRHDAKNAKYADLGFTILKLNRVSTPGTPSFVRLLCRQEGSGKITLNTRPFKGMSVIHTAGKKDVVFTALVTDIVDGESRTVMQRYVTKCGKADEAAEFYKVIREHIPQ
ncbi:hypothetical protein GQ42DRAFT_53395 [Ramicandelaber brevisporus]|nr:hypothetical protein GQ42DRAFT_53395 [Ramicandelaber brevisporus]